jgi:hypothetical protein
MNKQLQLKNTSYFARSKQQNLEELMRLTLINILNAKGVIYTYYKQQQEREKNAHRQIHNSFYGLYLEEWKAK